MARFISLTLKCAHTDKNNASQRANRPLRRSALLARRKATRQTERIKRNAIEWEFRRAERPKCRPVEHFFESSSPLGCQIALGSLPAEPDADQGDGWVWTRDSHIKLASEARIWDLGSRARIIAHQAELLFHILQNSSSIPSCVSTRLLPPSTLSSASSLARSAVFESLECQLDANLHLEAAPARPLDSMQQMGSRAEALVAESAGASSGRQATQLAVTMAGDSSVRWTLWLLFSALVSLALPSLSGAVRRSSSLLIEWVQRQLNHKLTSIRFHLISGLVDRRPGFSRSREPGRRGCK